MKQQFSFLIELAGLKFDEVGNNFTSWTMAMPIGNYQHPKWGPINITPDRIKRFADNVNGSVRGQQLDIDYDHKEYNGEAAGWVNKAEARSDGLWILVEWTKKAYEAIQSKAYRYFSPEFEDTWSDPRTGEKFKDVLFGGGITNRPFLKGIQPLNLSEFFDERTLMKENGSMTPEQLKMLAELFGLDAENVTADMIIGAASVFKANMPEAPSDPAPKPINNGGEPATEPTAQPIAASEKDSEMLKKLSDHPTVKKLTETLEAQNKKLSEMIVEKQVKKLSETAATAGRELPPVTEQAITKLLSESPSEAYTDQITKLLSDMLTNVGPIAGENGGQHKRLTDTESDSTKKFTEAIDKLMKDDPKLSYTDAAVLAASQDSEGYDGYRQDTYIKEGE